MEIRGDGYEMRLLFHIRQHFCERLETVHAGRFAVGVESPRFLKSCLAVVKHQGMNIKRHPEELIRLPIFFADLKRPFDEGLLKVRGLQAGLRKLLCG